MGVESGFFWKYVELGDEGQNIQFFRIHVDAVIQLFGLLIMEGRQSS